MKPTYFDIHTHVNFKAYDEDRSQVIRRCLEEGIWHTNVGTQIDTSKEALQIANEYVEGVYAIVGLHPVHTSPSYLDEKEIGGGESFTTRGEVFDYDAYKEIASHEKVVGIGECGLDYFRLEEDTKKLQKEAFEAQIALANDLQKPLMIHCRDAYEDVHEMLKSLAKVPANIHFFAGDLETGKKFLDLGCTLSFTGVITFTRDYDEVVKMAPIGQIMSETDAPYVTPKPHRGKRNEPSYVPFVVKRISEIKGGDESEVQRALLSNARRFFGV